MWWLVGALIFGLGVTLILLVVGASKLKDRHPTNRSMKGEGMFDERDVLLKAASIVEQGWCQGKLYDYELDRACALGAILQATELLVGHPNLLVNKAVGRVEKHLGLIGGPGSLVPLAAWNDTPGRTANEVTAAMRGAAL